jgi:hypothetical protein
MIKLIIACYLNLLILINAWQSELSLQIYPGNRECFHQYFNRDLDVEFDFKLLKLLNACYFKIYKENLSMFVKNLYY